VRQCDRLRRSSGSDWLVRRSVDDVTKLLDLVLKGKTFLAGDGSTLTVCDILLAVALKKAKMAVTSGNGARWFSTCEADLPWAAVTATIPAVAAAAAAAAAATAAADSKKKQPRAKDIGGGVKTGKLPALEGWEDGVMTRFPPEPSGYLHIGHVKAVMVNDFYARAYKGKLLVRFDDTNPSKEKEEFKASILEDLARLGVRPDVVSHTSDHFDLIADFARQIIKEGKAYMDDTPVEQMRMERGKGIISARKPPASDPETNLARFEEMYKGTEEGVKWCLRADWNMSDGNKCCRDPVLYRANATPHLRTGTKYKAYPTYDFACPIVDSIEGVSHAMRTTEYRDRDVQYARLQEALRVRPVKIIEFSRLNFIFTTLSKRKLTWFVDNKFVEGWNDPRFPTVQGVLRRGVQVDALRAFILAQGASKKDVDMEWDKFWAENRKIIDKEAHRFFAIKDEGKVVVSLRGAPTTPEAFSVQLHPKTPEFGDKVMHKFCRVFIEGEDAKSVSVGEEFTLMRWGNAIVRAVHKDAEGAIREIEADLNEGGDFKTTKVKMCWVPDLPHSVPAELVEFDNLITKSKISEEDKFEDFVNPVTKATVLAICEPAARAVSADQVVQFERRGFFRCDSAFVDSSRPMVMFNIPDGKTKAMSTLASSITSKAQQQALDRIRATQSRKTATA
jgi:glutamyl-tRNA synthetase